MPGGGIGAVDDGPALGRQRHPAGPASDVRGRHARPQQGRNHGPGRRADEDVGVPGVPAEVLVERTQHPGMEPMADAAAGAEHDRDPGHDDSLADQVRHGDRKRAIDGCVFPRHRAD